MRVNLCDHQKCRRKAAEAFDVRSSRGTGGEVRHYEVCEKHAALFNGGGWIEARRAEQIRRELVPS